MLYLKFLFLSILNIKVDFYPAFKANLRASVCAAEVFVVIPVTETKII